MAVYFSGISQLLKCYFISVFEISCWKNSVDSNWITRCDEVASSLRMPRFHHNQSSPFFLSLANSSIFLHSKPLRSAKTDFLHSSHAKTDFLHSKPFHSRQNRLPRFQAVTVRPKPISSIPSHSSLEKSIFLHSKPFQTGQNLLPPFQAIPVGPKTHFLPSKPFHSGQNQLPSFQAIPV
jgi:hypothetical protein